MLLSLWISLLLASLVTCQIDPDVPHELQECMESLVFKHDNVTSEGVSMTSEDEIQIYCLQRFLWKSDKVNWPEFNITQDDMDMINLHLRSMMQHGRSKRQVGPGSRFPRTGFRVRREYRRLRDYERRAFHGALNALKMNGQYDRFANMHSGIVVTSAHNGPNFLGWHRVYLAVVEEALRAQNRFVSLPYWDSTMDFDMTNPVDSVIWSPDFFGNGDGFVTAGPFRNWQTSAGRLTRNVGGASRVMSKDDIRRVMSRCRTREILPPTATAMFDLELAHGGPHVWVGGQMSGLNTAAHDPVFFLHHAFIDYIWEMFRNRQSFVCGVNPERDYPEAMGEHAAVRPMDGLPPYRNIDGYRSYWTRFWYRYERAPSCSRFRPFCGSPYLRCDRRRGRCLSMSRPTNANAGVMGGAMGGFAARGLAASNTGTRVRAAQEESTIRIGLRFRAPPSDGRSTDALLRNGRFRRSRFRRSIARRNLPFLDSLPVSKRTNASASNTTIEGAVSPAFGPMFRAPAAEERPVVRSSQTSNQQETFQVSQAAAADMFSQPFPLLPSIDFSMIRGEASQPNASPSFEFTWSQKMKDASIKAFIPVHIVYIRTQDKTPPTSSFFRQDGFQGANVLTQESPYSECRPHPSGFAKVTIQSTGINYMGVYSSQVEVDTSLPVYTATSYIRINPPNNGLSQTMLSAFHECGLMCQPTCAIQGTGTTKFRACTGIISVPKGDQGVIYGTSIGAAIDNMTRNQTTGQRNFDTNQNPRISFQCSNADVSSWSQLSYGPIWAA